MNMCQVGRHARLIQSSIGLPFNKTQQLRVSYTGKQCNGVLRLLTDKPLS